MSLLKLERLPSRQLRSYLPLSKVDLRWLFHLPPFCSDNFFPRVQAFRNGNIICCPVFSWSPPGRVWWNPNPLGFRSLAWPPVALVVISWAHPVPFAVF